MESNDLCVGDTPWDGAFYCLGNLHKTIDDSSVRVSHSNCLGLPISDVRVTSLGHDGGEADTPNQQTGGLTKDEMIEEACSGEEFNEIGTRKALEKRKSIMISSPSPKPILISSSTLKINN